MVLAIISFLASLARAEVVTRTITISWNPSISADVIGYRVRYGTHRGVYSEVIDAGNHTSTDIPNLMDGTSYFFTVTAYNARGDESSPSPELTHTPNPGVLLNLSTRARVQEGDGVVIAGFIIGGNSRKTIIIRGMGPSLGAAGIGDFLPDPVIELHGANGLIAENDNWRDNLPELLWQVGLAPAYESEAALVIDVDPGQYTATIRGKERATGITLLEIYDAGIPVAE